MKTSAFLSFCLALPVLGSCSLKEREQHDEAILSSLLQEKRPDVQACLSELKIAEKRRVRFRVDQTSDGRLREIRVLESYPGAGPLLRCLESKMQAWRTTPLYERRDLELIWELNE